ncbi:MAG TPA: hypothetical protein VG146_11410 [Verrucomicrobiae bacterium]|nr:hypothetical protein [Verrucomicrobiae bacterium]
MNRRPYSITIVGWLFIGVGGIAFCRGVLPLAQRFTEFKHGPFEFGLIETVRILALIGGVFLLRGFNWARWLLILWLAFHVILSAFHAPFQLLVHGLLAALLAYFLFRAPAAAYFRGAGAQPPPARERDETPAAHV